MSKSTLNDWREPAVICRERGWGPGTRLVGDEGAGPTVIEITAVGERGIFAKTISHAGREHKHPREGNWTLGCRDWKVVALARGGEGG